MITAVTALAAVRLYTEALSPHALGIAMLLVGLLALLDAVITLPIGQATIFLATRRSTSPAVVEALSSLLPRVVAGAVMAAVVAVLHGALGASAVPESLSLGLLFLGYLGLEGARAAYLWAIHALAPRLDYSILISIDAVLTPLFVCVFVFGAGSSVAHFFEGLLLARSLSLLITVYFFRRRIPAVATRSAASVAKELAAHAKPFASMGVLGWVAAYADRFVIAWTVGPAMAGVYAILNGLIGRPFNVMSAGLTTHYRPHLLRSADERSPHFWLLVRRWAVWAAVLGACATAALIVLLEPVVRLLLSAEYRDGAMLLAPVLAVAWGLNAVSHSLDQALIAKGEAGQLLRVQALSVPLSVAVLGATCLLAGPTFVAYARLASEALRIGALGLFIWVRRER